MGKLMSRLLVNEMGGGRRMNETRIRYFMQYDKKRLAVMLDEYLTMLDNIADQFGAEFLGQFVGEEE